MRRLCRVSSLAAEVVAVESNATAAARLHRQYGAAVPCHLTPSPPRDIGQDQPHGGPPPPRSSCRGECTRPARRARWSVRNDIRDEAVVDHPAEARPPRAQQPIETARFFSAASRAMTRAAARSSVVLSRYPVSSLRLILRASASTQIIHAVVHGHGQRLRPAHAPSPRSRRCGPQAIRGNAAPQAREGL